MDKDLSNVNEALKRFLAKTKQKHFATDRAAMVQEISQEVTNSFAPVLQQLATSSKINKEELAAIIKEIQVTAPEVNIPEIRIPDINVPAPQVTVNVPKQETAKVTVTPTPVTFPSEMSLRPGDKPFPVVMMDVNGKPMQFPIATGGGGKTDFFTVMGITNTVGVVSINPDGSSAGAGSSVSVTDIFSTVGANVINPDGRIKVELPTGSSGLTDTELRATAVPVSQLSGSIWSTSVIDIFGSTAATGIINSDNRLKVSVETGGSGLTDTELRATAVPVSQVSGVSWSTEATQSGTWNIGTVTTVTGVTNSLAVVALDRDGNPLTTGPIAQGDSATALRVVIAGNSDASVTATQTGTWNIGTVTTVTGVTNTVAAANVDSSGVQYSGSNPFPITGTVVVSSITASSASALIDSTGVQYSGSNPVPTTIVSGAPLTTNAVYTRQTNPTAIASDYVPAAADDLGRPITRPIQARDLIATAYVTLSTGTEATLLAAGGAGVYLDLISVIAANTSSAAQQLDIRATTGGNIVQTLYIPANATAGWTPPVPWPQDNVNNNWTVDMADVTNSNIIISALFSKEV